MLTFLNRIVLYIMVFMNSNTYEVKALQLEGVIFVRHGESKWNASMIDLGPLDLSLSSLGQAQAGECASKLKQLQQIKLTRLYSSPLLRAKETAEILANVNDLPLSIEQNLEERYFGDYRLLSKKEIGPLSSPPDAELKEDFVTRVMATVLTLIQSNENSIFIIVAHEKVFECLGEKLCGTKAMINFGEAIFFQRYNEGWLLRTMESLNLVCK